MRITVDMLDKYGACERQVELFIGMWGEFVDVSEQTVAEAMTLGLDIEWVVDCLLSTKARKFYKKAQHTAWKDYNKAQDAAIRDYEKVKDTVTEGYYKAMYAAWKDYYKAMAMVFVNACMMMDAEGRI